MSTIGIPQAWDICVIVTKDRHFYEGVFVGRLGDLLLFRECFWAEGKIPRAIKAEDVAELRVVMKLGPTTCARDYDIALASLLA